MSAGALSPVGVVLLGAAMAAVGTGSVVGHRRRAAVRRRCRRIPTDAGAHDATRRSPRPERATDGHRDPDPHRDPDRGTIEKRSAIAARWCAVEERVGATLRGAARRPVDAPAARRLGRATVAVVVLAVGGPGPVPALVVGFAIWAVPLVRRAARRARRRAALLDETPEIVDLVRLGIGSGLNVRLAVEAVVRHHDGLVAAELGEALARAARGDRLADALDTVTADGGALQPLIDALVATERYGAPLVASLDRVSGDARTARRRRREEAARRVPVKLLFPLVFCTLPAFAILTVVPVLLRSLPSLAP